MTDYALRQSARAVLRAPWYGLTYLAGHDLLRKDMPLIRGLVLTDRCNLHPRHCDVVTCGPKDLAFGEVKAAVDDVGVLWGASRRDLWPERAILS